MRWPESDRIALRPSVQHPSFVFGNVTPVRIGSGPDRIDPNPVNVSPVADRPQTPVNVSPVEGATSLASARQYLL